MYNVIKVFVFLEGNDIDCFGICFLSKQTPHFLKLKLKLVLICVRREGFRCYLLNCLMM